VTPRDRLEHEITSLLGPRLRAYFPASTQDHPGIWLSQTFTGLAEAIEVGDAVAVSLACDLIHADPMLPFGKLIKSDLARALRKRASKLLPGERALIVATTLKLLKQDFAPRELEDYCKLLRKFPAQEYQPMLPAITPKNAKSVKLHAYLAYSDA
jgi:hypothetical protein